MSTLIEGYLLWNAIKSLGKQALVLAHTGDSTQLLWSMVNRYFNNLPDSIKPETQYASKYEKFFHKLDSRIVVGTAGASGLGRGGTTQFVHASEVAFYPSSQEKEMWNGLMQSVPRGHGSIVVVESTANGQSGLFYDLWTGAVRGENEYTPLFFPWHEAPEYSAQTPVDFERTPDEDELAAKYDLTDNQLYWRRLQIAQFGPENFDQEYPISPEVAFISTGANAFKGEWLTREKDKALPLLATKLWIDNKWQDWRGGHLKVYKKHDPNDFGYVIGADVGHGIRGKDYTVATVLDSHKNVVAVYRSWVQPDYFAHVLAALGDLYNRAYIVVENNGPGLLVCSRLWHDLDYGEFYTEEQEDKITHQITVKLGFNVNKKTKPAIIDKLRGDVRDENVRINDLTTLDEMRTYVLDESGSYNAEGSANDDTVIALALANYVHPGIPDYFEVPEEYLFEPL